MWSFIPIRDRSLFSFLCSLVSMSAMSFGAGAAMGGSSIKVFHHPKQPVSGDRVIVTVEAPREMKSGDWLLQYQVAAPGKYIDRDLEKGHTDRVRARIQDGKGRWGHGSPPTQFRLPP